MRRGCLRGGGICPVLEQGGAEDKASKCDVGLCPWWLVSWHTPSTPPVLIPAVDALSTSPAPLPLPPYLSYLPPLSPLTPLPYLLYLAHPSYLPLLSPCHTCLTCITYHAASLVPLLHFPHPPHLWYLPHPVPRPRDIQ